jgi:glutamine amidotransferase
MSKGKLVTVVDYGVGNLLSVARGVKKCGAEVLLTRNREDLINAERIILPGVGAFANAMNQLKKLELVEPIVQAAQNGTLMLGVCLGMQLLFESSEEFGYSQGLGLIPGKVVAIPNENANGEKIKIPQIGWRELEPYRDGSSWHGTILESHRPDDSVYFIHSFMAAPSEARHRLAKTTYCGHDITAVVAKDNVIGCQFHPEKSGEAGLDLIRMFLTL